MRLAVLGLVALSVLMLPASRPAFAHDDGLTCHAHPRYPTIVLTNVLVTSFQFTPLGLDVLSHAYDNLAAAKIADGSNDFSRADAVAALGSATEFAEMVESIRLLALRIDRADDPAGQTRAQRIAEDAFARLPIANYLAFEDFLADARVAGAIQVDLEALVGYLETEAGVSTSLTSLMQDAMANCG